MKHLGNITVLIMASLDVKDDPASGT